MMEAKRHLLIGLLYLFAGILTGLDIPFSRTVLKSDSNHIPDFFRVSPPDGKELQLQTDAWLWYDEAYLYVLFESEINQDFVEGKHAAYDGSASADYVRIQLVTEVQNYFAYGFYAYPLGSKYDFIRNSELDSDKYWNSRYSYTTEASDSLWKVIFKIPFSDLRHAKKGPHDWKIILTRYCRKSRETYNTPFVITKMGNDYFRKALDIRISQNIRQQNKFIFKPYAILTYDLEEKDTEFDEENVGIDISYNPSFSTRMKLSISPDYSDIPMDEVEDTYNSKYTPTKTENRYFFIEDFNAFGVGKELFYSRRIIQPQYAFKMTSNNEHYSLGILSCLDKLIEEKIYDPDTDSTYIETENPDDFFNIVAFQPTWERIRCQFTLLNRINEDYHNEVLHANPIWEISRNSFLWSNLNYSFKQTDENDYLGYYGKVGFDSYFQTAKFSLSAQQMSEDYRASMGKIYEDDFFGWNLDFEHVHSAKYKLLKEIDFSFSMSHEFDNKSGNLLERYISVENSISTDFNIDFDLEFEYVKENITPTDEAYPNYTQKLVLGGSLEWDYLKFFVPGLCGNLVRSYFYKLSESYDGYVIQAKVSGILDKYISYFCSLDYAKYDEMPQTTYYDDDYSLINFDLTINLSNRLTLTNGLRYNNYEYYGYSEYIGCFSNFKWEMNSKCNLFAGIKYSQDTYLNERFVNYNNFYLKVIYIF